MKTMKTVVSSNDAPQEFPVNKNWCFQVRLELHGMGSLVEFSVLNEV